MLLTYFISPNYDKLSLQGRVSLCNRLADIEGKINIDLFLLVSNFKEPAFLWFCLFYALLSWYSSEILCKIPVNSLASSFFSRNCQAQGIFWKYKSSIIFANLMTAGGKQQLDSQRQFLLINSLLIHKWIYERSYHVFKC